MPQSGITVEEQGFLDETKFWKRAYEKRKRVLRVFELFEGNKRRAGLVRPDVCIDLVYAGRGTQTCSPRLDRLISLGTTGKTL